MNLLYFKLDVDFGESFTVVANNEADLEEYLIERGFTGIVFSDLRKEYGTCQLKNMYGTEIAKCFYVTKV